jgi:hypothetical protein
MLAEFDERLVFVVVGLGLLLALVVLARLTRGSAKAATKVIALGSGHRLHVVELEGRRLLIGTGPSGPPNLVTELADLPAWTHAAVNGDWQATRAP